MFGTSIHWTTFFYLLIDLFIVIFACYQSFKLKRPDLNRYILLGLLFIAYNASGGFLPANNFPGPFILQYIITYGIAILTCIYVIFYLYKEFDIVILRLFWSITNISIMLGLGFICLFLIPYFISDSLDKARFYFTIPFAFLGFYFLGAFHVRIIESKKSSRFIVRRNRLSILSLSCIVVLPIFTVIGDYQWLTFTAMNISFFAITVIEIDRYLYFLENKNKMFEVFAFYKNNKDKLLESKLIYQSLTRREIEIALSVLSDKTYKEIGEEFFITERTVSKHASNIFKKTGVSNKADFVKQFSKKSN